MTAEVTIEDIQKIRTELKRYNPSWAAAMAAEMNAKEHRIYGVLYGRLKSQNDMNSFVVCAAKLIDGYKREGKKALSGKRKLIEK